jgi:hypothetical protein
VFLPPQPLLALTLHPHLAVQVVAHAHRPQHLVMIVVIVVQTAHQLVDMATTPKHLTIGLSHDLTNFSRRSNTKTKRDVKVGKGNSIVICAYLFHSCVLYMHRDGPLQVYFQAGKMIPHVVDPWIHLQQVFVTALSSEGHLQAVGLDDALENETETEARCFILIVCQVYALNIILQ